MPIGYTACEMVRRPVEGRGGRRKICTLFAPTVDVHNIVDRVGQRRSASEI